MKSLLLKELDNLKEIGVTIFSKWNGYCPAILHKFFKTLDKNNRTIGLFTTCYHTSEVSIISKFYVPKRHMIFLHPDLTIAETLVTLWHEEQHWWQFIHRKPLCEYDAEKYALKKSLSVGSSRLIRACVNSLKKSHTFDNQEYRMAAKKIKKLSMWKEALKYA